MDYSEYQTERAPTWLQDVGARAINEALGFLKDAFVYSAKEAVKARFPTYAPLDAMSALAADRSLLIGYRESAAALRERLRRVWRTAAMRGTKPGMIAALNEAGYSNVDVREQPQDGSLQWWEFDVWIFAPFPWPNDYLQDGRWDDAGTWDDGGLWANEIPLADVGLLRAIVRKGTPRHARCRQIVVVHAGESWDASAPPGTWDDIPTATWGNDVTILQVTDAF